MLAVEHHPVKAGEPQDLDQHWVAGEALHAQGDLVLREHLQDVVLLIHVWPSIRCLS
jgi:hypothetical protein